MHRKPGDERGVRVGYVLKKYPRLSETFILNELLGLEELSVSATVLSLHLPDEGRFHREVADFQGDVVYIPDGKGASVVDAFGWLARHEDAGAALRRVMAYLDLVPGAARAGVLMQGLRLAQEARARDIGHLHAHFMTVAAHTACIASLVTGIPFTVTAHAKDIFRDTVDRRLFRRTAELAASVVTVCDYNRELIRENLLGDSSARVTRIYNGLPLAAIPRSSAVRERDLILAVGRLVEKKGFHVLLQAVRLLKERGCEPRVVVVGDGDQRDRLARESAALGLDGQVTLLGARPRDEVLRWMERARVLAAPCVVGCDGNRDALPTVLIEALAMGLPSVTTAVSGIPEIVEHEVHGLIVPEELPLPLANALQRMLEDDDTWSSFSARGPARALERFDRSRTLPVLGALFQSSAPRASVGGPR